VWSLGCVCTHSSQRLKYNVFPPLNAMFSALVFPSLLLCVFITVYYKAVCEGRGAFGNRTQNSRVDGARPNHQPIGRSDPNHQGILCGLVCPSRTSEREGEGYCVKGGWREGEERVRRSVNPIPNPDPNPTKVTKAPQMSLKEA
jgi:hypothetical protein